MEFDQQPIYPSAAYPKIYTTRAVQIGTFLGGPLVAGYLIAENYRALNQPEKATKTWIYTSLALLALLTLVFSLSENNKIPHLVFPVLYSSATYYLVQYLQGRLLAAHLAAGAEAYNWGRVVVIGIIGTVITLAIIVIAALFLPE